MNKSFIFLISAFLLSNSNQLFSAALQPLSEYSPIENFVFNEEPIDNPSIVIPDAANINKIDPSIGSTPLTDAAYSKNKSRVLALLKAGADIYLKDSNGENFLTYLSCDYDLRKIYYEFQNQATKRLWSILCNHNNEGKKLEINKSIDIKAVKEAIEAGADLDSVIFDEKKSYTIDKSMYTLLHITVIANNFELVKLILDNSKTFKNIDMHTNSGDTALMKAAKNKNIDIITALLGAGANVNVKSSQNFDSFQGIINSEGYEEIKKAYEDFHKYFENRKPILMEAIPSLPVDLADIINNYDYSEQTNLIQNTANKQIDQNQVTDNSETEE